MLSTIFLYLLFTFKEFEESMNKIGNGLVFECQLSGETMVNYYHVEKRDSKYYAIAEHDSLISQMELGGWLPPGIRQATANILNLASLYFFCSNIF